MHKNVTYKIRHTHNMRHRIRHKKIRTLMSIHN